MMTQLRKDPMLPNFIMLVLISRFSRKTVTGMEPISLISMRKRGMGCR